MKVYAVVTRHYDYAGDSTDLHSLHKTKESAIEQMNDLISAWEEDLILEDFYIDKSHNYYNCYDITGGCEAYAIEIIEKELK
jgi:hypothetical protein